MKLWDVECKGKFLAKAKVYAESRQDAKGMLLDTVAQHIATFADVPLTDIITGLRQCEWTATECEPEIINLVWDIKK